jgi:hypothetical protein
MDGRMWRRRLRWMRPTDSCHRLLRPLPSPAGHAADDHFNARDAVASARRTPFVCSRDADLRVSVAAILDRGRSLGVNANRHKPLDGSHTGLARDGFSG